MVVRVPVPVDLDEQSHEKLSLIVSASNHGIMLLDDHFIGSPICDGAHQFSGLAYVLTWPFNPYFHLLDVWFCRCCCLVLIVTQASRETYATVWKARGKPFVFLAPVVFNNCLCLHTRTRSMFCAQQGLMPLW